MSYDENYNCYREKRKAFRKGLFAGFLWTVGAAAITLLLVQSTTPYFICVGDKFFFTARCIYKFF